MATKAVIVQEQVSGAAGLRAAPSNKPTGRRLEEPARRFPKQRCFGITKVATSFALRQNHPMEAAALPLDPFATGSVVVITLGAPREKFWGVLLGVSTSTVTVAGIDLNSFDDLVRTLRADEPAAASVVLFPMHRVERIEL